MAMTLTGSPQITAAALDAAINTELTTNWFPLAGVTTNSNAVAGTIGEYIAATVLVGSAVAMTNSTSANITSISLTPGDWDVWGTIVTSAAGTTVTTFVTGAINTVSATLPTAPGGGAFFSGAVQTAAGVNQTFPTGLIRQSLASTTTVYLVANIGFTTSTMSAYGFIGARRVR